MTDAETPAAIMANIETHLWNVFATGANPWRAGGLLLGKRLGMTAEVALRGVLRLGGGFVRVMQHEDDPRRFRLATIAEREKATPALILHRRLDGEVEGDAALDDLLALSLAPDSRRFWRLTCKASHLGDLTNDGKDRLDLRQDAHAYVARLLKSAWAAARADDDRLDAVARIMAATKALTGFANLEEALAQPAEDLHRLAYLRGLRQAMAAGTAARARWAVEMRPPSGCLILDPVAINWTRRGALYDVEAIDILDAPATGHLGRALRRLNTTIGTPKGVPLYGVETTVPARGRAA